MLSEREKLNNEDVALIRIEQLFPLHLEKIQQVIDRYPNVEKYVWAQEEPRNMGAWSHIMRTIRFDEIRMCCQDPIIQFQHQGPAQEIENDSKML